MHADREFTLNPLDRIAGSLALESRALRIVVGCVLSAAFAGLTVAGANIVIPIQPVPITMQTLFVLLAGASIGRAFGTLSQAMYVGLGTAGLPVFASGAAGAGVLAGPTGGYLISFLVAPWVVGWMLRRSSGLAWQAMSFAAGTLVIFTIGITHLTLFYTHDVGRALAVGLLPFLPGAVLKIVAATSIHRSSQALMKHYGTHRR